MINLSKIATFVIDALGKNPPDDDMALLWWQNYYAQVRKEELKEVEDLKAEISASHERAPVFARS